MMRIECDFSRKSVVDQMACAGAVAMPEVCLWRAAARPQASLQQAVVKVSTACEAWSSAPRRLRDTEISYGFLGVSAFSAALWYLAARGRTSATGCEGRPAAW